MGATGKPDGAEGAHGTLSAFTATAHATVSGAVVKAPFTVALMGAIVLCGLVTGSLFRTSANNRWFEDLAYGLPAFGNGDWLTAVTGTFVLSEPVSYLLVVFLLPLSVGWLEVSRGTRSALTTFFLGQFASLAAVAAVLLLFRGLGSPWIDALARDLDTGPTGGIFACLTFAVCHLRQPWRLRWQFLLASFAVVSVTLVGEISDLERAAAITLVLLWNLRTFARPTLREQRFIAWVGLLSLVGIQVLTIMVPTNGPFGPTQAGGGIIAVLVDTLLAVVLTQGLRAGRRAVWVAAIVLSVLNVLRGIVGLTLIVTLGPELSQGSRIASFAAAHAALWALMLAYLILCWRAFGVRRRRHLPAAAGHRGMDADEVLAQLRRYGGGTISWMGTWRGNQHFRSGGGSSVAYQVHAGCAIGLGEPIGPPADRDAAMATFATAAEKAGLCPFFFSTDAPLATPPDRWRAMQIAEDTLVDLSGLEFAGKKWSDIRTALNRAAREGITFRATRLADEPASVRTQLEDISKEWVGDKSLPEIRFTLGTLQEAADPMVVLALAEDTRGEVQGFLSWMPVHAPGGRISGWTLDLMRRRDFGFASVMEFLIASSLKHFSAAGADFVSLSGAPLAHTLHTAAQEPVDKVLASVSKALEPLYGFGSLHAFKAKFNPRTAPMYLVYRDESDLPRIAGGLTRAFLPEATVAQLAREGFGALRDMRAQRR
ncbi:bifunctional lysylphosphatidylglycerol flippase/synthetase MprF [Paeniglutamicibacter sp. R2-26]|uniref:bifunctional lysylphosphatidylglycerol flippase/synthetase MprF n=1 Tax=Paeniglutamicibacter sp. R2-26 TaxID=3144417 RepID=UPI003EE5F78C